MSDAYWRCSPPHTPIMKYIGSSTTSKNTKNKHQVLGDERARHADLQHERQHQERLGVAGVRHVVPRVDDDEERDEHRQDVERQADAVEADRVVRLDDVDPLLVDRELERAGPVVVEHRQRPDADRERGAGRQDRDLLVELLLRAGDEQHHEHADHRQERAEGEQVVVAEIHGVPLDVQEDEHDAADHGAAEQQRAVLVDLAGLDGLQGVAAFRRHVPRCVDRAVDDAAGRRCGRAMCRSWRRRARRR